MNSDNSANSILDRVLVMEMVRVTEAAAVAAADLVGRGDEKAADAAAVEAMRKGAVNYLCKPVTADQIIDGFEPDNHEPTLRSQPPSVEELEWEHIQRVLAENDGNISATARALNMHRRTLQRKLGKHSRWRE